MKLALPRVWSSMFARALTATLLGVAITVAVAIAFMARAMTASAEAGLVDFAVDGTERTRASIRDRLSEVDAELTAAAWAFRAARAFEVPTLLPPVVLAARVDGPGDGLEIERSDGAIDRLVAATLGAPRSGAAVADETTLVVSRTDDDVEVHALVDLRSLLPGGTGTMWLARDSDEPRLAMSHGGVLASRRADDDGAEVVETATIVGDGIVLHARYPLARARAGVRDTVVQAVASASVLLAAIVLGVSFFLARVFTAPVRELASAVRGAVPGRRLALPASRHDEIGDLGNALATMHEALRRDAELLGASASFARRMTFARDAPTVLKLLGRTLAATHPTHDWRVLSVADLDARQASPTERPSAEEIEAALVPHVLEQSDDATLSGSGRGIVRAGEHLLFGLVVGPTRFGCVTARGPIAEPDARHVEVLLRTALAALQSLSLAQTSVTNEKLAVLGRLSASVTHEMNNPLASVLMNLEMLADDIEGDEPREMLADARAGAERLAAIVRDLSAISRGGSAPLAIEDVDSMIADQIKVASAKYRRLAVSIEGELGLYAVCVRSRVEQAILNLIVNAADATARIERAHIVIRTTTVGDETRITVIDNGSGIPASVRRNLFEPFITSKGKDGTGLGLYLSRSLMQAQRGDLVLDATGHEGTSMTIRLPSASAPDLTSSGEGPAIAKPRGRVLVIDDDAAIVRAVERLLGRHAEVTGTSHPREGLELARASAYTLVLCDWDMPELSGIDILSALKAEGWARTESFVLMTGGASAAPAGVRMVRKPLRAETLLRLLHAG